MIKFQLAKPTYPNKDYFNTEQSFSFHQTLPGYQPTPLHILTSLAEEIKVAGIYVKDESQRFDLEAFKILGAAWAMAKVLAEYHNFELEQLTFTDLIARLRGKPPLTFVTATDGNHGRGVARAALWYGQNAIVFLPQGAAKQRVEAIRREGATANVLPMNYDDAVRLAAKTADENGWLLLQDTAFDNYKDIAQYIMEGYQTIIEELYEQLDAPPTHLILQAGVGSFAGAIIDSFIKQYKFLPTIIIVEPINAACYYHSIANADGFPHPVKGDLATIMAGLACGEPNPLAWPLIKATTRAFFAVDDEITRIGMRRLARPYGTDEAITAGESGAVGLGLLEVLCTDNKYQDIRGELKLDENAIVLCINTEGATDKESYQRIIGTF